MNKQGTSWQKVGFYDAGANRAVAWAFLATDSIKKIAQSRKLKNRVRRVEQRQDFDVWREDKTGFRFTVTKMGLPTYKVTLRNLETGMVWDVSVQAFDKAGLISRVRGQYETDYIKPVSAIRIA